MKKKLILSVALVALFSLVTTNVQAQERNYSLGGGFVYATEDSPGFFVKGLLLFNPPWEAAASFSYFPNENLNLSALDADIHYVFYNDEYKLASYLLGGVDIQFLKSKSYDYSDSAFGFNIGAGLRYQLSERLSLNPELKYVLATKEDASYFAISIGLLF